MVCVFGRVCLSHVLPCAPPLVDLWDLATAVLQLCQMYKVPLQIPAVLSDLAPTSNGSENAHALPNPLGFPSDFSAPPPLDFHHPQGFEGACDLHTAPHALLCEGSLLQLLNPTHQDNVKAFNAKWIKGEVRSCDLHVTIEKSCDLGP